MLNIDLVGSIRLTLDLPKEVDISITQDSTGVEYKFHHDEKTITINQVSNDTEFHIHVVIDSVDNFFIELDDSVVNQLIQDTFSSVQ